MHIWDITHSKHEWQITRKIMAKDRMIFEQRYSSAKLQCYVYLIVR